VAKLDATGSALVYSTYLGGSNYEVGYGIAVDTAGNAYVTGPTASSDFPVAGSPVQSTIGRFSDIFVARLDAAGSALVYSTYLGGSNRDVGYGIAVDKAGNAYVTGPTASSDFPVAGEPVQVSLAGGSDAFVTKVGGPD
jgi:phosphoribosylcarboxyaminoimidazole (NCAIR) mutase